MRKNGKARHQAQREQVEGAALADALVDRFSRSPKRELDPVAQDQARQQEGEVAPIDAANEAITVPQTRPKSAPAARVRMVAPGSESPVTAT